MRYLLIIVMISSALFTSCDVNIGAKRQQLSKKKTADLAVLCKIWGYIKYHHPAARNGTIDMDYELISMIDKVLIAEPEEDINHILVDWVKTIDSGNYFEDSAHYQFDTVKSEPDLEWLNDRSVLGNELAAIFKKIHNYSRSDSSYFVSIHSLSGAPIFTNEISYENMEFPDKGKQLLALFRFWNAVEYYFPYKYIIPYDWDDILMDFIPSFVEVTDALSYRLVTAKLIATLHDSHASLVRDSIYEHHKGQKTVPVEISFVENRAIITDIWDDYEFLRRTNLQKGDIIMGVKNVDIDEIVDSQSPYASASNQLGKLKVIAIDLLRTNDSELKIQILRNGKRMSFTETTYPISETGLFTRSFKNRPCYRALTKKVNYLYLSSANGCTISNLMNSEGLIIDMRGYPAWDKLTGFPDNTFFNNIEHDFAIWTRGSTTNPGYFHFSDTARINSELPGSIYQGKIAILVNEVTLSQAEFLTMLFSSHPNSVVVGSQTAGANGNVTTITLPDNLIISFSGIGIYYPDRTETQQNGVQIDHHVNPTLEGVINGKDEILEKALSLF